MRADLERPIEYLLVSAGAATPLMVKEAMGWGRVRSALRVEEVPRGAPGGIG